MKQFGALTKYIPLIETDRIGRWLQRLQEIDNAHSVPLQKIQIISDGICYGPCPEPEDEVMQRLTIRSDGRVWFTGYQFGTWDKRVLGRKMQFKIDKDRAHQLFEAFNKYFSSDPLEYLVTDVGSWDLVLTDTNGNKHKFQGSMYGEHKIDGIDLSDLARELLPIEDLWVFCRQYSEE